MALAIGRPIVQARSWRNVAFPFLLLALPLVALGAYSLIAVGAGLAVVRWAKSAENMTDYSVMNTAKAMLWLPTSRAEKYKAKQAIATFFVRLGDVCSAALVFAGTTWLGFERMSFVLVNLVVIGLWLVVAWLVLRAYRELSDQDVAQEAA